MKINNWSRHLCLALGLLAIPSVLAADPISIGFERFPGPDGTLNTADDVLAPSFVNPLAYRLGSQFSSLGVTFSERVCHPAGICASTIATSVGTTFGSGGGNFALVTLGLEGSFSVPIYGISIESNSNRTGTLTAFDATDAMLASSTLVNANPTGFPLTRGILSVTSLSPIARFLVQPLPLSASDRGFALDLDNLVLQTDLTEVAPVPEPASMILLGTGLLGVGFRRWQQRRHPTPNQE